MHRHFKASSFSGSAMGDEAVIEATIPLTMGRVGTGAGGIRLGFGRCCGFFVFCASDPDLGSDGGFDYINHNVVWRKAPRGEAPGPSPPGACETAGVSRMKITDLKCVVLGKSPVVRITTDAGSAATCSGSGANWCQRGRIDTGLRQGPLNRADSTALQPSAVRLSLRRSQPRLNCPLWTRRSSSIPAIVTAAVLNHLKHEHRTDAQLDAAMILFDQIAQILR